MPQQAADILLHPTVFA